MSRIRKEVDINNIIKRRCLNFRNINAWKTLVNILDILKMYMLKIIVLEGLLSGKLKMYTLNNMNVCKT